MRKDDIGVGLGILGAFVGLMTLMVAVYYAGKVVGIDVFLRIIGGMIFSALLVFSGLYLVTRDD